MASSSSTMSTVSVPSGGLPVGTVVSGSTASPVGPGKIDSEYRPLIRLTVYIHETLVLLDDTILRLPAPNRSLANFLGSEERLEDVIEDLPAHPSPLSLTVSRTYSPGLSAQG